MREQAMGRPWACSTWIDYCSGRLTVFAATPFTDTTSGCNPVLPPAGTVTVTTYSPTCPGASMLDDTSRRTPPIVTSGICFANAFDGDTSPVAGRLSTGPSPFA